MRKFLLFFTFIFLFSVRLFAAYPFTQAVTGTGNLGFETNTLKNVMVKPAGFDSNETAAVLCSWFEDFSSYASGSVPAGWNASYSYMNTYKGSTIDWMVLNGEMSLFCIGYGYYYLDLRPPVTTGPDLILEYKTRATKWRVSDGHYFSQVTFRELGTTAYISAASGVAQGYYVRFGAPHGYNPPSSTYYRQLILGKQSIDNLVEYGSQGDESYMTRFHKIKIVAKGEKIKVDLLELDGTIVTTLDYTDPSPLLPTTGKIIVSKGYYVNYYGAKPDAGFNFDDFKLYSPGSISLNPGTMVSIAKDYNYTTGPSRITWSASVPAGTSLKFYVRSASSTSDLEKTSWGDPITESGKILGTLKKWVQYKAELKTNDKGLSPELYSVKIEPFPLKKVVFSPSSRVGTGKFSVNLYFNERMNTGIKPPVKFTNAAGLTKDFTSTSPDGWQDSYTFRASYTISDYSNDGFANLIIGGAKTSAGATIETCTLSNILVIDAAGVVTTTQIEFFPNPFSPNGDGKFDQTWLINLPTLTSAQKISVYIYNLNGALVRKLVDDIEYNGDISLPSWNGKDDAEKVLPVGLYIYQIKIGTSVTTGSVVLVK